MRDPKEFQEIENLGEEEIEQERSERPTGGFGAVPLVQAVLCALVILALVLLKFTSPDNYGKVKDWYEQEAAQEIELPSWGGKGEPALPSQTDQAPSAPAAPSDGQVAGDPPQEV